MADFEDGKIQSLNPYSTGSNSNFYIKAVAVSNES